jgi:hypothetical protein
MDKKLFFVIGSTLVVIILAAIWGYLLFFSAPGTPGTFTDFGFGSQTEPTTPLLPPETVSEEPVINLQGSKLRQLTTRPVAGYRELTVASSSPRLLRYVEAGTGHLYEINLVTGQEVRVSGTTLAVTSEASISPDGTIVLARSGQGERSTVHIGSFIGTSSAALTYTPLSGQVIDFTISKTGELLTAVSTDEGVVATERSEAGETLQTLFTVPFREVSIHWGEGADATHYLYPKPTRFLEGALYATNGSRLERLPVDGFGMTAIAHSNTILFSKVHEESYDSFVLVEDGRIITLPIPGVLPDKCHLTESGTGYCASSQNAPTTNELPDIWYQGAYQTTDWLWQIDLTTGSTLAIADLFTLSGREIDIINLTNNSEADVLYFINKNDLTLWMYELP